MRENVTEGMLVNLETTTRGICGVTWFAVLAAVSVSLALPIKSVIMDPYLMNPKKQYFAARKSISTALVLSYRREV